MRAHVLHLAAALAFASFCFALASCLSGCAAAARPPEIPPEIAAEASYGSALQRCVEKHDTEGDIDACANGVRRRWLTDGGAR